MENKRPRWDEPAPYEPYGAGEAPEEYPGEYAGAYPAGEYGASPTDYESPAEEYYDAPAYEDYAAQPGYPYDYDDGAPEAYRAAPRRRLLPVWLLVVIDVLCIGVGLNVFALFHHVVDLTPRQAPLVLPAAVPTPTPAPTPEPEAVPASTPARVYSGVWGEKFAEHFTTGEIIQTETSYRSGNVSITYSEHSADGLLYHVADIYLSDLKYLRTGFSLGEYGHSAEDAMTLIGRYDPIVALSGDYCLARREGVIIRNGVLYQETPDSADLCVLYDDGTLRCMAGEALDVAAVKSGGGVYQVWTFGPTLLSGGQLPAGYNTTNNLKKTHPRSAIGYVEPGHYIFVQADGRVSASNGMTLEQLSRLFQELGCTEAYNLDGGASSVMAWQGERVSSFYDRYITDIIYIADAAEPAA